MSRSSALPKISRRRFLQFFCCFSSRLYTVRNAFFICK